MPQICSACGHPTVAAATVCSCGTPLSEVGGAALQRHMRRSPFPRWFAGYSRPQVDAFVERLSDLLAAYETGTVTNPALTSKDVRTLRFRVAWQGYKPDVVDEFMAQAVAMLLAREEVSGIWSPRTVPAHPPKWDTVNDVPRWIILFMGSFIASSLVSVVIYATRPADASFIPWWLIPITGLAALVGGRFAYVVQAIKAKRAAVVVGILGWLVGLAGGFVLLVIGGTRYSV